jgi:hypothetical protein
VWVRVMSTTHPRCAANHMIQFLLLGVMLTLS